jgi:hypothetical protein
MARVSVGVRIASPIAAVLLVASTLLAATTVARSAAPAILNSSHAPSATVHGHPAQRRMGSRASGTMRSLLTRPAVKLPFDPAKVSTTLSRLEARSPARLTSPGAGSNVSPAVVGPPAPDPVTDSGAGAAAVPVATAGQGEAGAGGVEPPDSGIAMGPDVAIEADNLSIGFVDRTGAAIGAVPMPTFFGLPEGSGVTFFDAEPRVHFDTDRQRWIATELSWDCAPFPGDTALFGHGYIDLAISDTSDPLGTWTIAFAEFDDAVPDEPSFGMSTTLLQLDADDFAMGAGGSVSDPGCASGAFDGNDLVTLDWAQLGPHFNPSHVNASIDFDSRLTGLRVALEDPATDPYLRMIEVIAGTTPADINYEFLTGSAATGTLTGDDYDLTTLGVIPGVTDPPDPQQPGGTLTTGVDGRPDNLIFDHGILAFTSTYPCTPTGDSAMRDCVRVTSLGTADATAEPTRLADTLLGTNGFDDLVGGIARSGNGVLMAAYTQSSTTSDASSFATYNLPGGGAAWSAPQLLTAGAGTYTGTRWGDYNVLGADAQDPTAVWSGGEYAAADGSWATTINELVVGDTGAGYVALSPVRVLDTRAGTGLSGAMAANIPRSFVVGNFNPRHLVDPIIPPNAVAITANLTVTGATAGGYVALSPLPSGSPGTEALSFPTGDNRANNVTIGLAPDGTLAAVYRAASGKHADLILDVTGYFLAGSGQHYSPISPVRILDSRSGLGTTKFHANVARSFVVAGFTPSGAGSPAIPPDAVAISANLTVTNQTVAGHVTVTPTPNNHPGTSTINFPLKDNRANGLTIPIDPLTGKISAVFTAKSGTVDMTMDVTGYYSADVSGLLFHPLDPGRRVDTRLALGTDGFGNGLTGAQGATPRPALIAGHLGVPGDAAAITGDLTITGQTALGHVTITPVSNANPTTSTLNFPLGDTRSNGITVPLAASEVWFVYQGAAGKHVQVILDITGYFE